MLRALLFIAGIAFAGPASAQYKWVDQNGRVQYGDTPPPGASVSTVRRPSAVPSQPEATDGKGEPKKPLTSAEKDAEFRKRQQDAAQDREKQAKTQQEAADKRENCARAKENLRVLEMGRVARIDSKGERYYLDDAQLQQESARARQDAQDWCS